MRPWLFIAATKHLTFFAPKSAKFCEPSLVPSAFSSYTKQIEKFLLKERNV
jgi:hypothetical protein